MLSVMLFVTSYIYLPTALISGVFHLCIGKTGEPHHEMSVPEVSRMWCKLHLML